jgi:hypothetical protein
MYFQMSRPIVATLLMLSTLCLPPLAPPSQAADNQTDWDGRWVIFQYSAKGDRIYDKIPGAIDIRKDAVMGLWAGCFWLPVGDYTITSDRVRARFPVPGAENAITMVRIRTDLARIIYGDDTTATEPGSSESGNEFAYRVNLADDCPMTPPMPLLDGGEQK